MFVLCNVFLKKRSLTNLSDLFLHPKKDNRVYSRVYCSKHQIISENIPSLTPAFGHTCWNYVGFGKLKVRIQDFCSGREGGGGVPFRK